MLEAEPDWTTCQQVVKEFIMLRPQFATWTFWHLYCLLLPHEQTKWTPWPNHPWPTHYPLPTVSTPSLSMLQPPSLLTQRTRWSTASDEDCRRCSPPKNTPPPPSHRFIYIASLFAVRDCCCLLFFFFFFGSCSLLFLTIKKCIGNFRWWIFTKWAEFFWEVNWPSVS